MYATFWKSQNSIYTEKKKERKKNSHCQGLKMGKGVNYRGPPIVSLYTSNHHKTEMIATSGSNNLTR